MTEINIGMFSARMNELIVKHQKSMDLYLDALSQRDRRKKYSSRWFVNDSEIMYHASQCRYYDQEIYKILVAVRGNCEIQNIINANEYLHDKLPTANIPDNTYAYPIRSIG